MKPSTTIELTAFAALVAGTDWLLGRGVACLVLGVVLLVIAAALDRTGDRWPRMRRNAQEKWTPAKRHTGPHPQLALDEAALDAAASAYELATRRLAAERREEAL